MIHPPPLRACGSCGLPLPHVRIAGRMDARRVAFVFSAHVGRLCMMRGSIVAAVVMWVCGCGACLRIAALLYALSWVAVRRMLVCGCPATRCGFWHVTTMPCCLNGGSKAALSAERPARAQGLKGLRLARRSETAAWSLLARCGFRTFVVCYMLTVLLYT